MNQELIKQIIKQAGDPITGIRAPRPRAEGATRDDRYY